MLCNCKYLKRNVFHQLVHKTYTDIVVVSFCLPAVSILYYNILVTTYHAVIFVIDFSYEVQIKCINLSAVISLSFSNLLIRQSL